MNVQPSLPAGHPLADALSTQEPQDCVIVGGGDHIHKLREKMWSFKVWTVYFSGHIYTAMAHQCKQSDTRPGKSSYVEVVGDVEL